ncbi:DUF2510 domain-containing protein [Catellatospora chokoriensis]|uniref:DUF2510 domain-containing protein n=1 Tax=Catellatospora chokoriensis TaxID=310353 RepID=A0A8J3JZ37_9ACTN|nr:DUF2510 domain-containing protein [Catellatospora chokoriensis]GIF93737.1 hypothetical protein Cch02nite_71810 [Catellatospora chokoriensis]
MTTRLRDVRTQGHDSGAVRLPSGGKPLEDRCQNFHQWGSFPTTSTDSYVRYWTGQRWSEHTAKAGIPLPPPESTARIAAGTPRSGPVIKPSCDRGIAVITIVQAGRRSMKEV